MNSQIIERLTLLNTGILVLLVWKVFLASDEPVQPSVESASVLAAQSTAPLSRLRPRLAAIDWIQRHRRQY